MGTELGVHPAHDHSILTLQELVDHIDLLHPDFNGYASHSPRIFDQHLQLHQCNTQQALEDGPDSEAMAFRVLKRTGWLGISADEVLTIFDDRLPPRSHLLPMGHVEFLTDALESKLVQAQLRAGMYDLGNVADELLLVTMAEPRLSVVMVDATQLAALMADVPRTLAHSCVELLALHAGQHLRDGREPHQDWESEPECARLIASRHPRIASRAEAGDAFSEIIRRVMGRLSKD